MRQATLAEGGFAKYRKATRKEKFLNEMERIVPWKRLTETILPHYPAPPGAGRRPKGVERMLRIYFLQQWFQLSDPGAEEALYDTELLRRFAGFDLGQEPIPDETTICKFRHLLEKHDLGAELFCQIDAYLSDRGLKLSRGTIMDATLIAAPTSTKNRDRSRDPQMHSTKKGNQWHFGMKAHIGVDSKTKRIHAVAVTAANVHDSRMLPDLLRGDETRVWGDSAYSGQSAALRAQAPRARDFTQSKGCRNRRLSDTQRGRNRNKAKVRAKVEHVFQVMKCRFGYRKTRYKGLSKNANQVFTLCALVNLVLAKRRLLHCWQG